MKKRLLNAAKLAICVLIGMIIMAAIDHWPMILKTAGVSADPEIVVIADYPNRAIVEFVLTEPIAPFFYVGEGDVGMRKWISDADGQWRWDPLHAGIDDALALMDKIRQGVDGLEGGVAPSGMSAEGYTIRIRIAESHLGRKAEIIEQVLEIIEAFEKDRGVESMESTVSAVSIS